MTAGGGFPIEGGFRQQEVSERLQQTLRDFLECAPEGQRLVITPLQKTAFRDMSWWKHVTQCDYGEILRQIPWLKAGLRL